MTEYATNYARLATMVARAANRINRRQAAGLPRLTLEAVNMWATLGAAMRQLINSHSCDF